jgi:BirA family biotin operon repressor/biotin-[acetyl-CoA-carboxylase] ligase
MKLDVEVIQKHLAPGDFTYEIRVFDTVTSTNAVLRELAKAGAREGTVVIADEQTTGHGRLGKSWFSPPGVNLYASVLFRPQIPPRDVAGFSFLSSVALADAITTEGIEDSTIKWPNDLLVGGKKVAGTLVESATIGDRVDYVILGVGVNLNVTRRALREALGDSGNAASSLSEVAKREIDRNAFAASFLTFLAAWAATYEKQGPVRVLETWRDRDILTGRRVAVRGEGISYTGRVLGVDREGYLLLLDTLGKRRRVLTGEVQLAD